MREFTSFRGPFRHGWRNEEKRALFLGSLARVIKVYVNRMCISYLPPQVFTAVNGSFNLDEWVGRQYSLAAILCYGMAQHWLRKKQSGDLPAHIFESGDSGQSELEKFLQLSGIDPQIRSSQDPLTGEWVTPFQAADLVAYEYATEFHRQDLLIRTHPTRRIMQLLGNHIPCECREITIASLTEVCESRPQVFRRRS
jgi:hypothetical protein